METDPLFRLLLSMAVPGLLGNLTTYLYRVVDQIFVGNFVGRNALGGISVLNPFNNVVIALSLFITVGGVALLAVSIGSKNYQQADKLFTNIVVQAILMSAVVTAVFEINPEFWVRIFGAKEGTEVYNYAVVYLRIITLGQVFNMLNLGLAAIIRTEGAAAYSMAANMLGAVVNIGMNTIFILIFNMGVAGAAWGTVASQLTGAVFSGAFFLNKHTTLKWMGLKAASLRQMVYIAKMGIAPSIFQVLSFVTNILLNRSLQYYGDQDPVYAMIGGGELCISAMAVVQTCENLIITSSSGVNQGGSPVISYNYGAKNYGRVWRASLISQAMAFSMAAAIYLLMQMAPDVLINLFSKGDEVLIQFGREGMHIAKIFALFSGYQMLVSMFFSATCKPEVATLVSLSRHGIFLIPALIILPSIYGLRGVLYANAFSDGCSLILVSILYINQIIRYHGYQDGIDYDDSSFIVKLLRRGYGHLTLRPSEPQDRGNHSRALDKHVKGGEEYGRIRPDAQRTA